MTLPTTVEDVHAMIEGMLCDHGDLEVDCVETHPWGVVAGFHLDGVAFDQGEIIQDGDTTVVGIGEEEFRQSSFLRIDCEELEEDEDEGQAERPECVLIGIHTMGETGDDDYEATYGGRIFMLAPGGDRDAWKEAVTKEHDGQMRRSLEGVLELLSDVLAKTSDAALAGLAADRRFRMFMRRMAAAA